MFEKPTVVSTREGLSLYFSGDHLHSQMSRHNPGHLAIDYTRTMMGFLLFNSTPVHIAMIGLGGGSLLKFCYHHLPQTQLTAIEINPHVIALKGEFEVPDDPARITLICGDGAEFVRTSNTEQDVLMVDGFDGAGQALSLCSQAFYNDCFQTLSSKGLMVANLNPEHPDHEIFMGRIRLAFDNQVLDISSAEKTNQIVFACKGHAMSVDKLRKSQWQKNLNEATRAQLGFEFKRITRDMKEAD
jgi:spermidine synthase